MSYKPNDAMNNHPSSAMLRNLLSGFFLLVLITAAAPTAGDNARTSACRTAHALLSPRLSITDFTLRDRIFRFLHEERYIDDPIIHSILNNPYFLLPEDSFLMRFIDIPSIETVDEIVRYGLMLNKTTLGMHHFAYNKAYYLGRHYPQSPRIWVLISAGVFNAYRAPHQTIARMGGNLRHSLAVSIAADIGPADIAGIFLAPEDFTQYRRSYGDHPKIAPLEKEPDVFRQIEAAGFHGASLRLIAARAAYAYRHMSAARTLQGSL